jgi:PAS domain S-box-containing protein
VIRGLRGQPALLVGAGSDITERKRTEQQLRVKDAAINSAINGTYFTDLNGVITYVNKSFLTMLGYHNASEVTGKGATAFVLNRRKANEITRSVREKGSWTGELQLVKITGEAVDVHLYSNLVLDENDRPLCTMGSFNDISRRKKNEQEIEKYKEHLEELVVQRTQELKQKNKALKEEIAERTRAEEKVRSLIQRLVEVQEKETQRIGQDLHDVIGSSLTVLKTGHLRNQEEITGGTAAPARPGRGRYFQPGGPGTQAFTFSPANGAR